MQHNQRVQEGATSDPPISILAIDPHDEFKNWHLNMGGADGLHGIVEAYSADQRQQLVEPFYYGPSQKICNMVALTLGATL
jgi:hypothetical protein